MVPETLTHSPWSQARVQERDPKSATQAASQKGVGSQQAISSGKRAETYISRNNVSK